MSEALTKTTEKPASQPMVFKASLEGQKGTIAQILPKGLTVDRIVKVMLVAAMKNPKLYECSPASIIKSIADAAQLGFELGSPLGHAYPVPFFNKKANRQDCQMIIGYKGLIKLATGDDIERIEAVAVHRGDVFKVSRGLKPQLIHEIDYENEDEDDTGELIAVYAIAWFRSGGAQFEVMNIRQVEAIRKRSQNPDVGPWRDHYEEMARKSVTKKLIKYLDLSVESAEAIAKAEAIEVGDIEPQAAPLGPQSQLAAKIEASAPVDLDDDGFAAPPPAASEPAAAAPAPQAQRTAPAPAAQAQQQGEIVDVTPQAQTASDEQVSGICKRIFACATQEEVGDIRLELEEGRKNGTLNLTKAQGAQIRQSLEGKSKSLVATAAAKAQQ